jgi:lipoprotein-anchoring transpeptidase ErfK/SrfK
MPHVHLRVLFFGNRDETGILRVEQDGRVVAEFPALGRGSRGRGDTSLLKDGNTPTGDYTATGLESTAHRNQKSYGPWGAVRLKPFGGQAMLAERVGQRSGLLIHGGSLGAGGYWRGEGALRATHGCIRLSNEDMKMLKQILENASLAEISCVAPTVTLSVEER